MTFNKKSFLKLTTIGLLTLGVVSGCGNSDKASTGDSEDNKTSVNRTDTKGGSVTICYPDILTTAFLPFSSTTGDRFSAAPAIESLGRVDEEGEVNGWLAESFDVDPDNLTVTIKLKEGIQFSDGTDFNADAVIWNFDKMVEGGKDPELGSPTSYEKTNEQTIVVHYEKWANDWPTVLSEVYIYSPEAFEKNGEDWAAINAVGTGPFVMKEYVQKDHITYEKNDNYWIEGKPYLDELKIVYMTDVTAQQAAFMNGEVDIISTRDATLIQTLEGSGFENIANEAPDLGDIKYIMYASGDKDSPFHEVKVRQAVTHTIDWEGYVKSLTSDLGIPITQFGVPGAWSYDESVEFPEFNVDKAKSLLKEAGYEDGFDTTITTRAYTNDIAVLLQESLKEIGISANIKIVEESDFNAEKKEGTYGGGIIVNQGASKMDFTNNYIRLYSSKGINYLNMMDHPEPYEKALFGARESKELDKKKELLQEASRMLSIDYALITPVAAVFANCYSNGEFENSGIYEITQNIWTPEELKKIEK